MAIQKKMAMLLKWVWIMYGWITIYLIARSMFLTIALALTTTVVFFAHVTCVFMMESIPLALDQNSEENECCDRNLLFLVLLP
jgi:hypothetical protein